MRVSGGLRDLFLVNTLHRGTQDFQLITAISFVDWRGQSLVACLIPADHVGEPPKVHPRGAPSVDLERERRSWTRHPHVATILHLSHRVLLRYGAITAGHPAKHDPTR